MNIKLKGVGVALVTPFTKKLQIDFDSLAKLLKTTTQGGVDYLVVNGSTGESVTTSLAEKREILSFVQKNNTSHLPIVYGMGGNNTTELLNCIDDTDFRGIDAILSVSPYYNRPSQEGIYLHYESIANKCPVPVLLYNVPSRTGSNIDSETVIKLSRHPNIIGIKEASGNLLAYMEIVTNKPADFLLIAGDDIWTLPIMAIGGAGVISTLANAFPRQMVALIKAIFTNDYVLATKYQLSLLPLQKLIAQGGNPLTTKEILYTLKICEKYVRLPLLSASDKLFIQQIQDACEFVINQK